VGAHQAHVQEGSAARAFACSECHITPDPATDIYAHITGVADVDFGALSSTAGATPAWNGTTCSTYCHGATLSGGSNTAPEWTRVDGTQGACGSCHGLPPTSPGHPQSTKCSLCHPTVDRDLNFVDKARHVDGVVDLVTDYSCNRCHGSAANAAPPVDTGGRSETNRRGVGAHQAHVAPGAAAIAAPLACSACHNPLPSPADPIAHVDGVAAVSFGALARADGAAPSWNGSTCTTYCHGQTLGGGSNTSPIWTVGDGSQDACGTCHGLPPSLPHPQTSPTGCGDCHPNVSRDGSGQWVFADVSLHVNGHVEENAPTTCNACHGSVDNAAPPVDSQGRSNPALTSVGAHQAHVVPGFFADAIPCQDCHVVPTDLSHIDGVAQVTFGGLAAARSATTSWNGSRCSVYCHGTPLSGGSVMTPLWTGGATQVFCGSCHGMPPVTTLHPVVSPTSCATCHGDVVNADLTWKNKSLHCDGVVEYGGSGT
jgi:predicted CxxxxCH...CXXCH cytochrome family protein